MIQGQRCDTEGDDWGVEPGEYGHTPGVLWYCRPPNAAVPTVSIAKHTITEHEDGTITVSPSILIDHHQAGQWHGFLERGVWREV